MAGENIVRDFTTEQLKYIYDEVIDDPYGTQYPGIQTVDHTAIVEKFYGVDYASILGAASGERDSFKERNNIMAQNLIKTWEDVGTIDTRYQGLFSKLKSTMQEYLKAVNQIAEMIDTNKRDTNLGIWSPNAIDTMSNITDNFNKKMQDYNDACVNDALDKMGITNPDERQDIKDFTQSNGYSTQQTVELIIAAQTELDKKALIHLVRYEFSELFAINPDNISPDMLAVIGNYPTILVVSDAPDKWNKITDFANGISEYSLDKNGELRPNYALDYFTYFQTILEAQLPALNALMLPNMEGYDEQGNIIYAEPASDYVALAQKIDDMTALCALWGFGANQAAIDASGNGDKFLSDMFPLDGINGYNVAQGRYAGFSFSNVTPDSENVLKFDIEYLQAMLRPIYPNSPNDRTNYIDYDKSVAPYGTYDGIKPWKSPQAPIKLNKISSGFDKAGDYIDDSLKQIEDARRKANDKYIAANISSIISFASSAIPGGSKILDSLKELTKIGKEVMNFTDGKGDWYALGDGITGGVSNAAGYIPEDHKTSSDTIKTFMSLLSNYAVYQQELKKLDKDKQDKLDDLCNLWFGFRININGTNDLPIDAANGMYFSNSFPLGWSDYKTLFAQKMWNQNGAGAFYPNLNSGLGANNEQNLLTGFNKNSALYQLLKDREKFKDPKSPTPEEWLKGVDSMQPIEKLAWFGEDPSKSLGIKPEMPNFRQPPYIGNTIVPPGKSVSTLTPEELLEFSNACNKIKTSCGSANINVDSPGQAMNNYVK